jgi:tRNA-specific 2-thiouridylase
MKKQRVIIGMSGGLDSSVAAYLLKQQGYDVIGITLKLYNQGSRCCSLEDIQEAGYIADYNKIIVDFCEKYLNGLTPNPCVLCNEYIKFGLLLDKAKQLNADYIATGHYVKKKFNKTNKRYYLEKGNDLKKDQSYFLYRLNQEQLNYALFPLSEYTKPEIRKIAEVSNIPLNLNKSESQEVCFVTKGKYPEFIKNNTDTEIIPGNIIDKQGNVLGRHRGIIYYTIGQRRGIGISADKPLYVIKINPETNTVIVGYREDTFKSEFYVKNLNWVYYKNIDTELECETKIRYNSHPVKCIIKPLNNKVLVKTKNPVSSVTPGQSAVFYKKNIMLGGGIIIL